MAIYLALILIDTKLIDDSSIHFLQGHNSQYKNP